ncbi:MAG: DUF2851 family protein [Chloroflexi bacterium]|nr:DUF2851 family protein [Chloroflexota bacterium]
MAAALALRDRQRPYRTSALSEEAVATAWQEGLFGGELQASSGERLQIVYRGWRSDDAGPDFRDSIIALEDGRLLSGDVEVHVRASDWRRHGHGRDRRYDGVVLHVVMWDDEGGRPTLRSDGASAPVLALHPLLTVSLSALVGRASRQLTPTEPCGQVIERLGQTYVAGCLDKAGHLRLAGKAAAFEAAIASRGVEAALYEGLIEALGYAKNREPFRQLAQLLPLASLEGYLQGRGQTEAIRRAEALLLGVAGLLPGQRRRAPPGDYAVSDLAALEAEWTRLDGSHWMAEGQWNFCRTRPENYPTRRIGGAARLVVRALAPKGQPGLVSFLLGSLDQPTAAAARRAIVNALQVAGEARPVLPGRTLDCPAGPRSTSLIGRGRAMALAINVVLPFAVAYGNLTSQSSLADRARWAYFAFPRLPSDAVVRQMCRRLFGASASSLVDSALRQQALHHIFKELCRPRRCHDCQLSAQSS